MSDHFDGERFFNPAGLPPRSFKDVPKLYMEPRTRWPRWIDEPAKQPPALGDAAAAVTFIGHATFLIQTPAGNVLTDPMYSMRAGPWNLLGPRRVRRPAIAFDDLPEIATVLLSHNHYDHCDLRTLRKLAKRFNPTVVTFLGNARLVQSAGIRRVVELDWWQAAETNGHRVTATPAQHFCARTPWDRNRALWGGFVLEAPRARIYFAGDTAFASWFAEIPARLGSLDLALLPIGAYEPRWFMQAVHMNPDESVRAHLALGGPPSIGMHFGTFQLTPEGIDEPVRALEQAREAHGIAPHRFRVLGAGESVLL